MKHPSPIDELTVKNFACLKKVVIQQSSYTILIGQQASGKSIIAKLFYFFKKSIWDFIDSAEEELLKKDFDARARLNSLCCIAISFPSGDFATLHTQNG